jgi:hypothetical protein
MARDDPRFFFAPATVDEFGDPFAATLMRADVAVMSKPSGRFDAPRARALARWMAARASGSTTHQNAGMLMGTYSTAPSTGRGTGTTTTIPGAASVAYYVIDSNTVVVIGRTSGDASPVLVF